MRDAGSPSNEGDWNTRSAEETVSFLNRNFGPDDCDRQALIAGMINIAIYEKRSNEALFWSVVFVRRERSPLSEEIRRELQALLDDSRNWKAGPESKVVELRRPPSVERRARGVREILRRAFRGYTDG